jgi:Cd(II)/Pb(II)-responsive transcriptional regulator
LEEKKMSLDLRIGELAKRVSCQVETIRFYEHEGLMPKPPRSVGNYRLYGEFHVERLLFIRRCRSMGMSLEETQKLLSFHDAPDEICIGVDTMLDNHIGHVADRISELLVLQKQLKNIRGLCKKVRTCKDCGILKSLGCSQEVHKQAG